MNTPTTTRSEPTPFQQPFWIAQNLDGALSEIFRVPRCLRNFVGQPCNSMFARPIEKFPCCGSSASNQLSRCWFIIAVDIVKCSAGAPPSATALGSAFPQWRARNRQSANARRWQESQGCADAADSPDDADIPPEI